MAGRLATSVARGVVPTREGVSGPVSLLLNVDLMAFRFINKLDRFVSKNRNLLEIAVDALVTP